VPVIVVCDVGVSLGGRPAVVTSRANAYRGSNGGGGVARVAGGGHTSRVVVMRLIMMDDARGD
jgi:hypothetical protein